MTELRPCPFCGSLDLLVMSNVGPSDAATECIGCGAVGPDGRNDEEAAALWNKRHFVTPTDDEMNDEIKS